MDKSNHTVTVPREYLDKLEAFYEENIVSKDFNVKALVTKRMNNNALIIFNTNTQLIETVSEVITLDDSGKEIAKFTLDKLL